jgi:hypothetical protein
MGNLKEVQEFIQEYSQGDDPKILLYEKNKLFIRIELVTFRKGDKSSRVKVTNKLKKLGFDYTIFGYIKRLV